MHYDELFEDVESADELILRDMFARRPQDEFADWLDDNNIDEECRANEECLLNEFGYWLEQEHSMSVRDGLVQFWMVTPMVVRLIGNHPVAVYHFTSSTRLKSIRRYGLTSDRRSINQTRTRGVYVTTETSGPPVRGYIRNAVQAARSPNAYGICLTIKSYLADLRPDPDDEDIRSGRHQFILDYVAPSDIVSVDRA